MLKPTTVFTVIDIDGDVRARRDTFEEALAEAKRLAGWQRQYAPYSVRACTETPLQQVYSDGPSYNPVVSRGVLQVFQGAAA